VPECTFNPFGVNSYDSWLGLDAQWQEKSQEYIASALDSYNLDAEVRKYGLPDFQGEPQRFANIVPFFLHSKLFLEPFHSDKCLADFWERQEWPGLNNDEQVMMRYRRSSYPAIVEVQEQSNDTAVRCTDLLDEKRGAFIVYDRTTARTAARFTRMLTWVCHYPHYSRIGPVGVIIPHGVEGELLSQLRRRAAKEGLSPADYLSGHFLESCGLIRKIHQRGMDRMIDNLDVNEWTGVYDLQAPMEEIQALLDVKPDFEHAEPTRDDGPEAVCYTWFRRGESQDPEDLMPDFMRSSDGTRTGTVGRLRLFPDRLEIVTMGEQKFRFARKMIEKSGGSRIRFRSESEKDIKRELREHMKERTPDDSAGDIGVGTEDRLPLELQRELMSRFYEDHYRKFLDEAVPALSGMTPREAARDAKMRPALLALMKDHLHGIDARNRAEQLDIDIDWVLDELGLDELKTGHSA
jgi:hypothetical protein